MSIGENISSHLLQGDFSNIAGTVNGLCSGIGWYVSSGIGSLQNLPHILDTSILNGRRVSVYGWCR